MVLADSDGISPVPPYSGSCPLLSTYPYGALTLYGRPSQTLQVCFQQITTVLQPRNSRNCPGLGSSPFARHYLGNHSYFLFLQVLRCFSSLRLPSNLSRNNAASRHWVVPFGYLRINSYVPIPAAFRSLSRPSSPLRAKASPIRPFLLLA